MVRWAFSPGHTTRSSDMMRAFLLFFVLPKLRLAMVATTNITRNLAGYNTYVHFNEFETNNSVYTRVEIAASKSLTGTRRRNQGVRRVQDGYYGDFIDFYDIVGNKLGTLALADQTPLVYQQDAERYAFATYNVNPIFLPKQGGAMCLRGNLFARVLYYGNAGILLNVPCSDTLKDADYVSSVTMEIPANGFSYQRFGIGFDSVGSSWRIRPETFSYRNQGQVYAVCPLDAYCGATIKNGSKYSMSKQRLTGCRTKCVPSNAARWLLRHGFSCGKCPQN